MIAQDEVHLADGYDRTRQVSRNQGNTMNQTYRAYWSTKTDAGHRYSDESWFKKYADELLFLLPSGGTLLDVGCGSCQLTTYLASAFDFVYAIDFSESMLAAGSERLKSFGIANVKLGYGEAERFPVEIKSVSAIVSNGVVQHLDPEGFRRHLQECYRVLEDDGVACIGMIPNAQLRIVYYLRLSSNPPPSPMALLKRLIGILISKGAAVLKKDFFWDGIGNWYSKQEIQELAQEAGFHVEFRTNWYYEYRFHAILRKHG